MRALLLKPATPDSEFKALVELWFRDSQGLSAGIGQPFLSPEGKDLSVCQGGLVSTLFLSADIFIPAVS